MSQQNLAEFLEIPRTTLGDYERQNTEPSIALLIKLSDYFDTPLEALVKKDLSLDRYQIASTDNIKILAISVDSDNNENIELVESKAEAGYLDNYQNPEYIQHLPKLNIPQLQHGSYRAFEIQGDSMLPVESGSIIVCSYVENLKHIKDATTCVVISKKDGLVYKRVKHKKGANVLVLHSDNDLYLPYELPYEEIHEVWQYEAHISFSDKPSEWQAETHLQIHEIGKKVDALYKRYVPDQ